MLSARDSAADLWLFWREMEKAVGRQGGDAAASSGIRSRLGVARFEISDVLSILARLSWKRSRCGQQVLLPALLVTRRNTGRWSG
jgi:hypothetical protein